MEEKSNQKTNNNTDLVNPVTDLLNHGADLLNCGIDLVNKEEFVVRKEKPNYDTFGTPYSHTQTLLLWCVWFT